MPAKREPIEIGKRVGQLTIVAEAEGKYYGGKQFRRAVVRCDCGTVKEMIYRHLDRRKSCGCLNRRPPEPSIIEVIPINSIYFE